ncbi:MAG: hypothetical protein WD601_05545 [Pseudohongiellaceae bacterium]
MRYFVEVLSVKKVWLINENRRLLSMHSSIEEACDTCFRLYKSAACVIDRRQQEMAEQ